MNEAPYVSGKVIRLRKAPADRLQKITIGHPHASAEEQIPMLIQKPNIPLEHLAHHGNLRPHWNHTGLLCPPPNSPIILRVRNPSRLP